MLAGIRVLGMMVARNRHQTALLRALADRLRREQAANAQRAVAEEQARIARELHDTVSHHIAAIAVQAQAARLGLASEPDQADTGLRHIAGVVSGIALLGVAQGLGRDLPSLPVPVWLGLIAGGTGIGLLATVLPARRSLRA